MQELPDILLAHGIHLKAVGNEYSCLCFSHDDTNPSMRVYRNGSDKWVAHCFSCSFHGDAVRSYCELNGLDIDNKSDVAKAYKALDECIVATGKQFATIKDAVPVPKRRPERTMLIPDADTPYPRMGWLQGKGGDKWGDPSEVFVFRQTDGTPLMYEARWNVADKESGEIKKECRCFTWGRRGSAPAKWECAHHPSPRPIYGLDMLEKFGADKQVVITEGPRKAFYAQQLLTSFPCVGWAGGANGWSKTDWYPLSGRNVILWPDADIPGRDCMEELAQHLIDLGCNVYILDTLDMPDAWDSADAVKEGWDTARTLKWAKEHKGEKIEKKTPDVKTIKETTETKIEIHDDTIDAVIESGSYDQPPLDVIDDFEIPDIPFHISEANEQISEQQNKEFYDHVFARDPVDLFEKFVVPPLQRDMLPDVISNHIFDIAEVINADPAFGAITALTTIGALLDDRIKIHLNEGYNESARIWSVCVGEPSTKKSPLMDAVQRPVSEIIKNISAEDAKVRQRQEIIDARYQAKLKEYTKACIDSDNHDLPEPIPPQRLERRRIKCDNLTREALEEVLRDMPYGVHLHADELAGWIGSMDAYKSAGVKADRALWLRAFNGGPMQVDRIARGSFLIENWSVSISGGIQPSKLAAMASQLDDDGLLQRFLVVCSERSGGQGLSRPIRRDWFDSYAEIFDHVANTKCGTGYVHLTPDAAKIRDDAVSKIYEIINSAMISRAFCTALGKWEGISARLILIFHAIECASKSVHVSSAHVLPSTATMAMHYMMHHLLPHMVSFYEDGLGQTDVSDTSRILAGRIIAEKRTELTLTWLGQHSPSKYRQLNDDKKKNVLSRLMEYGWIEPVGIMDGMNRRYKRYLVNPAVHEKFKNMHSDEFDKLNRARDMALKIRSGEMLDHNEKIY